VLTSMFDNHYTVTMILKADTLEEAQDWAENSAAVNRAYIQEVRASDERAIRAYEEALDDER
jgi:uncharacterized protein YciI